MDFELNKKLEQYIYIILLIMKLICVVKVIVHVKLVPCDHGMARSQVADVGDGLHIWRVAANILNKQSRAADKVWSFNLGIWR
jgi:hypothetical protein